MNNDTTLIRIENVKKHFPGREKKRIVRAVDGVSLTVGKGETLGLVGESGCGKSTLGRTILRLTNPTDGQVWYKGQNLFDKSEKEMRDLRKGLQMVFQNPYSSLNPRMTVLESVRSALDIFKIGTKEERYEKCRDILKYVGLEEHQIFRYPHEFSGGQRQRIVIARAIISNPDFVVCDEPVSALDLSVRAQVLNLMQDIQKDKGIAYLFISHDLSVVKHVSHRIAVMYLGKIVETAGCDELYSRPLHPYTQALLSAIPIPDADAHKERIILQGSLPSPANVPAGCRFNTRCPYAEDRCRTEEPQLRYESEGHGVACHLCQGG